MASNWCPGAQRSPQAGGVTLDRSLPARAVWHITWDKLTNGQRPSFSAVSNYLKRVGYCPHIMWDPFTGKIEQYYPANVGSRALAAWNQDGKVNIQIEVFFSPGTVYNGKKYATVADTPCKGLDVLMDWINSHGVPKTWPLGGPKWAWPAVNSGNKRTVSVWNAKGGHYGHCHVPDNKHTDPGPMPDLFNFKASTASTGKDAPLSAAEIKDLKAFIRAELADNAKDSGYEANAYNRTDDPQDMSGKLHESQQNIRKLVSLAEASRKDLGRVLAKVEKALDAPNSETLAVVKGLQAAVSEIAARDDLTSQQLQEAMREATKDFELTFKAQSPEPVEQAPLEAPEPVETEPLKPQEK